MRKIKYRFHHYIPLPLSPKIKEGNQSRPKEPIPSKMSPRGIASLYQSTSELLCCVIVHSTVKSYNVGALSSDLLTYVRSSCM